MKKQALTLLLSVMLEWIPLSAQTKHGQRVIEIEGVTGVFVPESYYRHLREGNRKGINYYTQWKITERQLLRSDSVIEIHKSQVEMYRIGMKKAENVAMLCDTALNSSEKINEGLQKENLKLQKKVKLIPWIGAGGLLVGGVLVGVLRD